MAKNLPNKPTKWRAATLRDDVIAGLSVSVFSIPQAMAYALIAGVSPINGLYALALAPVIYAILGSSYLIVMGPTAMSALMVSSIIGGLSDAIPVGTLVTVVAGIVGVIHIIMALGRAGFLINFLSKPVVTGFTTAVAIMIAVSQLPAIVGIDKEGLYNWIDILQLMALKISQYNQSTILLSLGVAAALLVLQKLRPTWPNTLFVVVAATIASLGLDLPSHGVAIVGAIPAGLPSIAFASIPMETLLEIAPAMFALAIILYMELIAVATGHESTTKTRVEPTRELIAIGAANIGTYLVGGMPVTAGFSRTSVSATVGTKGYWMPIIVGLSVAVVLLFAAKILAHIPIASLAIIIVLAVKRLINVERMQELLNIKRSDFWILMLTLLSTLAFGFVAGLGIGVAASIWWFLIQSTRPHYAVLGQLPGTTDYRNIRNYPTAQTIDGVLIVRIDSQLYFGNVSFLHETLKNLESTYEGDLHTVILEGSSINQLDSSADQALREIVQDYKQRKIEFLFANVKVPVRDVMLASGCWQDIGHDHYFLNVQDALAYIDQRATNNKL